MTSQKQLVDPKKTTTRDIRFDILKTLGICLIILAYVIPKNIFFHIRNFDVPLMVIVSGALFYYSNYNKEYSLFSYLYKRIPRIVAPVWLFLSFYFTSSYIAFNLLGKDYPFLLKKHIVDSFLLLEGIGYVWIIRVFILVAIASTVILNLYKNSRSQNYFFAVLSFIYLGYEVLVELSTKIGLDNNAILSTLVKEYIFYTIPYGCLFGLGLALPTTKRKSILVIAGVFLTAFCTIGAYSYYIQGIIPLTQDFKYPPRIYYVAYGIFMSMLAFIGVDTLCKKYNLNHQENPITKFIVFISTSTLWIYLWHIFFLSVEQLLAKTKPNLTSNYIMSFLVIITLSILTTYIQKKFISLVIKRTKFGYNNSEMLSTLFLK
jgi:fucose 4-O-acetylase-like acetyltransferase